jgi:two-component system response regulator YesN
MKFVDYVTQRKMERAARILTTSPAKIADIAAMVGYEDVKYFGQMFKKHTGKTPSEYREQGSSDKGQDSE